ncbi:MAG: hypothetical protein MI974_18580 [Chitinophagales bacterium]|nr:hypothetical protein [Chitinophagales bacterium]
MKYIFIFFFLSIRIVYSQSDTTVCPSLIFKDTINTDGELMLENRNQGIDLIQISSSGCSNMPEAGVSRFIDRIKQIETYEDSVEISVALREECCVNFIAEIQVKDNDTLNLIYKKTGIPCKCICLYELIYTLSLGDGKTINPGKTNFQINGRSILLSKEKYQTYPIRFDLFNGDTINLIDKYGMRQGYWLLKDSLNRIRLEGTYHNEKDAYYESHETIGLTGKIVKSYYQNTHQVAVEYYLKNGFDWYVFRRYDESGKVIEECLNNEEKNIWMDCQEY